ncbi:MAG TPA: aldose 1-epimerase [Patescibacteria group bacterium]|nr:aldose 1-epimerase [Patescibacteria group bacterium]
MNKSSFAFTIDKKPYPVITLLYTPKSKSGEPLSIKIAPTLGSNMFSFKFGAHDIIYHDPLLLERCGFTGCFVLFPTPNRVANFTYQWAGKRILMKKRGTVVQIHGLVFDEEWQFTKAKITKSYAAFETSISIDKKSPLFAAYPFPCQLTLEYRLYSNRVNIHYTVENKGSSDLPFGFALHPYFSRLSGNDKTYIQIPTASWMESPKDTLLPTGTLIDVSHKPYNVNIPRPVGKLSLDHVYTNLKPRKHAIIDFRTLGIKVHLKTSKDFTHMVVYTGHKDAVCIENQTCSTDAHNLWAKGLRKESHLIVLKPGKSHKGDVSYIIERY